MRIDIDDTTYSRNHGASPRGRGGWLFSTVDPRRSDYLDHLISTRCNQTFAEAKREAISIARIRSIDTLYVCP